MEIDQEIYDKFEEFGIPTTELELSIEEIHNIIRSKNAHNLQTSFDNFLNIILFALLLENDLELFPDLKYQIETVNTQVWGISNKYLSLKHYLGDNWGSGLVSNYYKIKFKLIFEEGGSEGAGEHVEHVYSLQVEDEHICYLGLYGSYDSEEGCDFTDGQFTIVNPYVHTQIRYK